jgi:non-ribosomal peptide synthetase component F
MGWATQNAQAESGCGEIRYIDYARWQRQHISGKRLEKMLEFWRGTLAGYRPFTLGEACIPDEAPGADSTLGGLVEFALDPATSARLRQLARERHTTLFAVFLTALYALIYRQTRQADLAIASPLVNRTHGEVEHVIGNFYNTRICRFFMDRTLSAPTLLARVHEMLMESAEYSQAPFDLVMREVAAGCAERRFLPVRLNVHDFRSNLSSDRIQKYLRVIPLHRYFDIAKFDIEFFINPGREYVKGYVIYATRRIDRRFAELLRDDFISILRSFAKHDDTAIEAPVGTSFGSGGRA